jgi:integrase
VFTLEHGAPIDPNTVGKVLDARVKSACVPKIRLHDVRHTHATLLLAAGANAMPGQQADAAAAVARLVDGAK